MLFPWVLLLAVITQVMMASVVPKEKVQVVKPGVKAVLLCEAGVPIESCNIDLPSGDSLRLVPDHKGEQGYQYYGDGFDKGHCGLEILQVKDKDNGVYVCTVSPSGSVYNQKANMTMTVAKAPMQPELSLSVGSVGNNKYKEGETLIASCIVKQGRPTANIIWFIGNERITDGLPIPDIFEYKPANLSSIQQNLTRRLEASDNGKELKCVADHLLLAESGMNTSAQQLNVVFGPKPLPEFEHFGLVEGEEGHVSVSVPANPKPSFTWYINDNALYEGVDDERYYAKDTVASREQPGLWDSVLVIKSLAKEDVDQTYRVEAQNKYGKEDYRVVISTNPEPKVLDLGVGTICVIVAAILIALTMSSLFVFARVKGRWCFADDGAPNVASESSDTESAAERSAHVSKKPTFKITFKKAPNKPTDPQQTPMADAQANQEEPKRDDEGVVYAELDLQNAPGAMARLVRPEDDKTEYAEILHSGKGK